MSRLSTFAPTDYITLGEAEVLGFGKVDTLKHRCIRGSLPCRKSGSIWLVRLTDLEDYQGRRRRK